MVKYQRVVPWDGRKEASPGTYNSLPDESQEAKSDRMTIELPNERAVAKQIVQLAKLDRAIRKEIDSESRKQYRIANCQIV